MHLNFGHFCRSALSPNGKAGENVKPASQPAHHFANSHLPCRNQHSRCFLITKCSLCLTTSLKIKPRTSGEQSALLSYTHTYLGTGTLREDTRADEASTQPVCIQRPQTTASTCKAIFSVLNSTTTGSRTSGTGIFLFIFSFNGCFERRGGGPQALQILEALNEEVGNG